MTPNSAYLVVVVKADLDKLPVRGSGPTLNRLPDLIDEAITTIAPGALDTQELFLLPQGSVPILRHAMLRTSFNYHGVAVARGEPCIDEDCLVHALPSQTATDDSTYEAQDVN